MVVVCDVIILDEFLGIFVEEHHIEQISYDCEKRHRDRDYLGFRMNSCRDVTVSYAVVFHSHTKSALALD